MCFEDSEMHPEIMQNRHRYLTIHPISKPPKFLQTTNRLLFLIFGPLKVMFQFWTLWGILGHETKPARSVLVQVRRLPEVLLLRLMSIAEPSVNPYTNGCLYDMLAT